MRRVLLVLLGIVEVMAIIWIILFITRKPSTERSWEADQALMPAAAFHGDYVTVRNIRNFDYKSEANYERYYYDKTFDLRQLESMWFIVEPFAEFEGAAHTLLSFGFANGDYVAISVEIRKERGESFSAFKGLLRSYELMYVVGDERDLIGLRANHRKDRVYLYPARASKEAIRAIFTDMLGRANQLAVQPEFYNTLTNTCTTNIVEHVNRVTPGKVPWSREVLMPGYADALAHELGLIDTTVPKEKLRETYDITAKSQAAEDTPDYSRRIRAGM